MADAPETGIEGFDRRNQGEPMKTPYWTRVCARDSAAYIVAHAASSTQLTQGHEAHEWVEGRSSGSHQARRYGDHKLGLKEWFPFEQIKLFVSCWYKICRDAPTYSDCNSLPESDGALLGTSRPFTGEIQWSRELTLISKAIGSSPTRG